MQAQASHFPTHPPGLTPHSSFLSLSLCRLCMPSSIPASNLLQPHTWIFLSLAALHHFAPQRSSSISWICSPGSSLDSCFLASDGERSREGSPWRMTKAWDCCRESLEVA